MSPIPRGNVSPRAAAAQSCHGLGLTCGACPRVVDRLEEAEVLVVSGYLEPAWLCRCCLARHDDDPAATPAHRTGRVWLVGESILDAERGA